MAQLFLWEKIQVQGQLPPYMSSTSGVIRTLDMGTSHGR